MDRKPLPPPFPVGTSSEGPPPLFQEVVRTALRVLGVSPEEAAFQRGVQVGIALALSVVEEYLDEKLPL